MAEVSNFAQTPDKAPGIFGREGRSPARNAVPELEIGGFHPI